MGYTKLSDACSLDTPCDDDAFGGGIFAGYDFNHYLGAELGYDILGDFETNVDADLQAYGMMSAITLASKFTLPLSEKFALFGKLGGAYMIYDGNNDFIGTASIGFSHQVSERIKANFEYQRFQDFGDDAIDELDADYLVEAGVNQQQINVEGKGELEPIASNDTEDRRAQNRRVEITIPQFEYTEL